MSKKKTEAPETGLEEINDTLTTTVAKVQENQKIIMICSIVAVVIIALVLSYVYFFRNPGIQKGNDAIGLADLELAQGNDSIALVKYMNVADNNGGDAANRAALQSAILLFNEGKYEEALKYADKYSDTDDVVAAAANSLKGDCYVNLDKLADAEKAFNKAISVSDDNAAYTPFFMLKLARVYRAQSNFAAEVKLYEQILKDYPLYGQQHNVDVEKLLDRAKLSAEAK